MKDKKNKSQIELKEFIQQALVKIVNGVKDAQDEIKGTNAEISPTGPHFTEGEGTRVIYKPGRGIVQVVDCPIVLPGWILWPSNIWLAIC